MKACLCSTFLLCPTLTPYEAHIIRRRSTTFYRTVSDLSSCYRWCLTGTPIQNTLDDIGALFSFLKVSPFDNLAVFRRYITSPFEESKEQRVLASSRLRLLLESLCLRRTNEVLNLPGQTEILRVLEFTAEERAQYESTKNSMNRALRQTSGEYENHNEFGMFQVMLQLRILCNHGTFQNPFSWTTPRDREIERETALDTSGDAGGVRCSICKQPMPLQSENILYHIYEGCAHICCKECLAVTTPCTPDESTKSLLCPRCEDSGISSKLSAFNEGTRTRREAYFRPGGFSTKIRGLLDDVQQDLWSTKSVIFSCWTRTLDLIQMHLEQYEIPCLRIDGDCPLRVRQERLDAFTMKAAFPVLMMTTGTGAFGLNIPIANRIFIVESQWNPHTERQAIARAMRIGQKHPVMVYKYCITQSVEQEMMQQQQKKLHIAKAGWDRPAVPRKGTLDMHTHS